MIGFTHQEVKAQELHFASIEQLTEQEVARIVLPQIYARLNKDISITPLPAVRAQEEANAGVKDGEILRIFSYGAETPNVVRVPTPYYSLTTAVFARKSSKIVVRNKSDLINYRIGRVRGVKHTENATQGLIKVFDSPNTASLFSQLALGNIDIALTNYQDGLKLIEQKQLEDLTVVNHAIAYEPLYHYVHKRHIDIVAPLNELLKDLNQSGELAKMISQAETVVY